MNKQIFFKLDVIVNACIKIYVQSQGSVYFPKICDLGPILYIFLYLHFIFTLTVLYKQMVEETVL